MNLKSKPVMKRAILMIVLLVALQPLLLGGGVLATWVIECSGGVCAGTVRASSPFGPPRDVLLTGLTAAAPYLLAVLIAAVAWLFATGTAAQPAAEPLPGSSAEPAVDRARAAERTNGTDAGGWLSTRSSPLSAVHCPRLKPGWRGVEARAWRAS